MKKTGMVPPLVAHCGKVQRAFEAGSFGHGAGSDQDLPNDVFARGHRPGVSARSAQGCILHVEDNPDDVVLLRYAFSKVGITNPVVLAAHGQEAIDYLGGRHAYGTEFALPRLVLLDVNMPVASGLDVLRWIQSAPHLGSLPIVMLTSVQDPATVEEARGLGARAYFIKPNDSRGRLALAMILKNNWLASEPVPMGMQPLNMFENDFVVFARL